MKSKELKTHNLPAEVPPISTIDARPDWLFILLMLIGFFSFTWDLSPFYGATLILTSLSARMSISMPQAERVIGLTA